MADDLIEYALELIDEAAQRPNQYGEEAIRRDYLVALASDYRRLRADNERLREALRDALVVFADTKWAEAYRDLTADPEGATDAASEGNV